MACHNFDDSIEFIETVSVDFDKTMEASIKKSKLLDTGAKTAKKQTTIQFKKEQSKRHAGNVSARQRATETEFKGQFYDDDGLLFCKLCNQVVEHVRRSSIQSHMKSAKHLKRQKELHEEAETRKVQHFCCQE